MADIQHSDVTSIHRFAYVTGTDPGAVGAYKAWVDTSYTPPRLKLRGAANAFWVDVGIWDTDLVAIANLTPAEDDVLQRKAGVWTNRSIAQLKTDLNLVIGTNVQGYDTELAALASLVSSTDKLPYFTGSGTAGTTTFTAFARTVLDDNTADDVRNTLGLGNMAVQDAASVAITGGSIKASAASLKVKSNGVNSLVFVSDETLASGDRNLNIIVNDSERTIDLFGDVVVNGATTLTGNNSGDELPSQTGNANKVLTTNGSTQSWGSGVMFGEAVANKGARVALTSKPRYYHVKQTDNGVVYVLIDETLPAVDASWLPLNIPGVKVFRAFITQTGTSTPTWTIVENGLQGTPTWSRTGAGDYTLTLTGSFAANKFFASGGVWYNDGTDVISYSLVRIDNDSAQLRVTRISSASSALTELSTVIGSFTGSNTLPIEFYVYQ